MIPLHYVRLLRCLHFIIKFFFGSFGQSRCRYFWAQLIVSRFSLVVEHLACNQKVAGSIPAGGFCDIGGDRLSDKNAPKEESNPCDSHRHWN